MNCGVRGRGNKVLEVGGGCRGRRGPARLEFGSFRLGTVGLGERLVRVRGRGPWGWWHGSQGQLGDWDGRGGSEEVDLLLVDLGSWLRHEGRAHQHVGSESELGLKIRDKKKERGGGRREAEEEEERGEGVEIQKSDSVDITGSEPPFRIWNARSSIQGTGAVATVVLQNSKPHRRFTNTRQPHRRLYTLIPSRTAASCSPPPPSARILEATAPTATQAIPSSPDHLWRSDPPYQMRS